MRALRNDGVRGRACGGAGEGGGVRGDGLCGWWEGVSSMWASPQACRSTTYSMGVPFFFSRPITWYCSSHLRMISLISQLACGVQVVVAVRRRGDHGGERWVGRNHSVAAAARHQLVYRRGRFGGVWLAARGRHECRDSAAPHTHRHTARSRGGRGSSSHHAGGEAQQPSRRRARSGTGGRATYREVRVAVHLVRVEPLAPDDHLRVEVAAVGDGL